jgi:uncharacterized protein (TIGR00725 family)
VTGVATGRRRASTRRPQVTVVGDTEAAPALTALAERVGALLARLRVTLITGGRTGVMEAACRGAQRAGGVTVGILPSDDPRQANPWCTIVIPTGLGHARNVVTALAADVVIAVGGGAGTLSELAFAWIHGRPILLLTGSGGWADALAGRTLDARHASTVTACADLAALEVALRRVLKKHEHRRTRIPTPPRR